MRAARLQALLRDGGRSRMLPGARASFEGSGGESVKPFTLADAPAFCPDGAEETVAHLLTLQEPPRSACEIIGSEADGFAVLFTLAGQRCCRALLGATELARQTEALMLYERITRPLRRDCAGVYLVACGRYVKIGRAVSIHQRVQALDNANPEPVRLLGILSWNPEDEGNLLTRMAPHRARGEWFHVTCASLELLLQLLVENLEREIAKP